MKSYVTRPWKRKIKHASFDILAFELFQNYPNPFNPVTQIKYTLPSAANVQIKVYNLLGNEIVTLVKEFKQAGNYEIEFDASNLLSGTYFYKIISGSFQTLKK